MSKLSLREANTNLWIIFFIWPAAALVESIRNYRSAWAKNGLWLFTIFFGYTFISPEGTDSSRYIAWFHDFHRSGNDLATIVNMFYAEGSGFVDVYQPLLTFIMAKFTGDYRVLFAVFGFVFGFFYSRNIWYILRKTEGKLNFYQIVLIIIFALTVPFWSINGVRFWTAAHIFLFGALPFLMEGKTKSFWISALSVFVHFSFIFPVLVLIAYRVIGNRTTIFFIFFIASSFISEINIPVIKNILINYTPGIFHDKITRYTMEDRVEAVDTRYSGSNWYVQAYGKAISLSITILLLVVFFKGREVWVKHKEMLNLFSFLLLFGGLANLGSLIPSVYRFLTVGRLFSVAFLFLYFYYCDHERLTRKVFLFLSPAIALYFVVAFRTGFDYTGVYTIITNPFIAPFLDNEVALIDLLK